MVLEERLARTERENRWLRRIGVLAIVVLLAVLGDRVAANDGPAELVGRSLRLVDEKGRTWFEVKSVDGGGQLTMYSGEVHAFVRIKATKREKSIALVDPGLTPRVMIGTYTNRQPGVWVLGVDGQRAGMVAHKDGYGGFVALDTKDVVLWRGPTHVRYPLEEFKLLVRTETRCREYNGRVTGWVARNGRWPKSLRQVVTKVEQDPWGHEYELFVLGDMKRILSYGPDGVKGTDDDIYVDIE